MYEGTLFQWWSIITFSKKLQKLQNIKEHQYNIDAIKKLTNTKKINMPFHTSPHKMLYITSQNIIHHLTICYRLV